jgi:short-subunit dehydrogenase
MVDLNVRIATDLSLRFVDSLKRHKGGILNVASVLGFVPGPGMAVYHATKAYLVSFSLALNQELKSQGVRVTALCPGPVDTEFGVRAKGFLSRKLTRGVDRVVREGVEGFMRGDAVVIPGRNNKVLSLLPRFLPRSVVLAIIGASKRERIED